MFWILLQICAGLIFVIFNGRISNYYIKAQNYMFGSKFGDRERIITRIMYVIVGSALSIGGLYYLLAEIRP